MKQLMFTPTGVCFNCLNGRHDICNYLACTCSARDHRQWWFRDDGINNEDEALRHDQLGKEIPDGIGTVRTPEKVIAPKITKRYASLCAVKNLPYCDYAVE